MIIIIGTIGLIVLFISWLFYVKKHVSKKVLLYSSLLYTIGCVILITYALLIKDVIFSILNIFTSELPKAIYGMLCIPYERTEFLTGIP